MKHLPISDSLKQQLEKAHGVVIDEGVHLVPVTAQMIQTSELDGEEVAAIASYNKAGGPPMVTGENPTIMRVVAWMCHEGINRNRQGFVKEELPAAAARIAAPHFLVMDWNHSAVVGFEDEQRIIGVWYKADYAFDPKAQKYGVLVTGVMFAWANPEIANIMLAEQERNGHLDFSMACIARSTEYGTDEKGAYAILHNPIFFTNSGLDVAPADPAAVGVAVEGDAAADFEESAREQLTKSDNLQPAELLAAAALEESNMEELQQQLAALEAQLAEKDTALEALSGEKASLEAQVAEIDALKTSNEEMSIKVEAIGSELATAQEALATVTAERDTLLAEKSDREAREAEEAKVATLKARIESLPESIRKAHAKRSEEVRTALEEKWGGMSDENWEFYRDNELLGGAAVKIGYVARSTREGVLPTASDASGDFKTRIRAHIIK